MPNPGDVILVDLPLVGTYLRKRRPALVLFEERDNIVVAAITSNPNMVGVILRVQDGALRDSVVKLNYSQSANYMNFRADWLDTKSGR